MLNEDERKVLGHLKNWSYAETQGGIKIFTLLSETLDSLTADKKRRNALINLIEYDADPPCFFEFRGLKPTSANRAAIQSFFVYLRQEIGARLQGSKAVVTFEDDGALSNEWRFPPQLGLWFQFFLELKDLDAFLAPGADALQYIASHQDNLLTIVQVDPGHIGHLSREVKALFEAGFRNLSIGIDHLQDWDVADFPLLAQEWCKILSVYKNRVGRKDIFILELHRIARSLDFFCGTGQSRIFIGPKGRIFPCYRLFDTDPGKASFIGNVGQGILEYDNLPFATFSREKMEGCGECAWKHTCANACLWLNRQKEGSFYKTPGSVCAYEKVIRNAVSSEKINPQKGSRFDDYLPYFCLQ